MIEGILALIKLLIEVVFTVFFGIAIAVTAWIIIIVLIIKYLRRKK